MLYFVKSVTKMLKHRHILVRSVTGLEANMEKSRIFITKVIKETKEGILNII